MVSRTKKATGDVTTYTYNVENQLTKVDSPGGGFVSYRYDGLGRRIEKNWDGTITQYIYDNEDIILETGQNQNILTRYTHGPGIDEPLIMDREGESYYYLADGLGSITTITDSNQNTINSYTYDSFGNIIHSTGSLANPYTYTAREYDPETGLYYYRARYYAPYIGRFLQEDPFKGFLFTPQSLNLYPYCDNNPVNWIDPYGLSSKDIAVSWEEYEIPPLIVVAGTAVALEPTQIGKVVIVIGIGGYAVYQASKFRHPIYGELKTETRVPWIPPYISRNPSKDPNFRPSGPNWKIWLYFVMEFLRRIAGAGH